MSWHLVWGATDGLLHLSCTPHPPCPCPTVSLERWPELTRSLAQVLVSPAWHAVVHGVTESDTTERANNSISCTAPCPRTPWPLFIRGCPVLFHMPLSLGTHPLSTPSPQPHWPQLWVPYSHDLQTYRSVAPQLCVCVRLCVCVCVCVYHIQLFTIPWTVACQTPLSIEFSQQEY